MEPLACWAGWEGQFLVFEASVMVVGNEKVWGVNMQIGNQQCLPQYGSETEAQIPCQQDMSFLIGFLRG